MGNQPTLIKKKERLKRKETCQAIIIPYIFAV